jgi:hypothetical protein
MTDMIPTVNPSSHAIVTTATVEWLGPAEGGRQAPPIGPQYVAPAKILATPDVWEKEAWSLVVQRIDSIDARPDRWLARVFWLMDDAPHAALAVGARLDLYEGRCVAHVTILGDSAAI